MTTLVALASTLAPQSEPAPPTDDGGRTAASFKGTAAAPNPVIAANGGIKNVSFYYGGTIPLLGTDPEELAAHLGNPSIVVTTPTSDEVGTVNAIHSTGAKAYRYIQFYWAPHDADYDGINLEEHPDWAFCRRGTTKSLGRTTNGDATKWYFIDTNETAVREQIKSILEEYKATGWDGVFLDRGEAATQYAADLNGNPIWFRRSSCTDSPYEPGARFADAYVNTLGLAHDVGLEAMMNSGKSPFDPITPLRPNPRDRHCQARIWTNCTFLSDVWDNLDLVLNETAGRPTDYLWERTFIGNRRSERNATRGQRTVGLITTASLGGAENQTRANVFYQWSRIKLFNLAVAVNTGDDECASAPADAVCNRYGVYPELVNATFGKPLAESPVSQSCVDGSKIHCVWLRRYAQGVNVVNVSATSRSAEVVKLGTRTCRYVYDVYRRAPLSRNQCVKRVRLKLPAWSGRPLKYSTVPW